MSQALSNAVRTWEAFWFAPGMALNLGAARVLFALHALWIVLSRDFGAVSALPPAFWEGVPEPTRWRYLFFPGHPAPEAALQWTAVACLVGALIGVRARVCCFLAGLLLYHLAPLEAILTASSPWPLGLTVSVPGLIVLSCSRSDDALAMRPAGPPGAASEYGWPLRLLQVLVAQAYAFAGYAKLFRTGPHWLSAETVRTWLLYLNQQDHFVASSTLGLWWAERPLLCLAGAVSAIAVSAAFVVAPFVRSCWRWLVPTVLVWHAGLFVTLGTAFLSAPQVLVFVDWESFRRGRRSSE